MESMKLLTEDAFGSVVLAIGNFVEAGSLPRIYARMEKPKDFKFVLVVCFSFFALFYPLIGVVAYHALGNDIQKYANVMDYFCTKCTGLSSALLAVTTGIFYVKSTSESTPHILLFSPQHCLFS
jgi:hypothetical protein